MLSLIFAARPDVEWICPDDIDPVALQRQLVEYGQDELSELCVSLANEYGGSYYTFILYERLAGRDIESKVDALVLWHRVEHPRFFQRLIYHVSLRGEVLTFGGHSL